MEPVVLTPREGEVCALVGQDFTYNEVAMMLGISTSTVRAHVESIAGKINGGTRARSKLIRYYATHLTDE